MHVLRSPHAHADIKKIDTSAAAKAPGVLLVLTGQDVKKADFGDVPCLVPLENRDGSPRGETPRPMLVLDRVRHVGDPVALVVAETLEQAKDAAELIEVDYEARSHVVGTFEAAQPARPGARPHQGQHRVRLAHGRPGQDGRRLRQGRQGGQAAARQPAAGRQPDGAARRDLRVRRQGRPLDAVALLPGRAHDPAGRGRHDPQDRLAQASRAHRRRGRRLRHEDLRSSGISDDRVGLPPAEDAR